MTAQKMFEKAEEYMNAQQWEKAIAKLDQALEINPDFSWGSYARGYCKYKSYQDNEAIADLNKTVAMDSKNEEAFYTLALIYGSLAQNAEEENNLELKKKYLISAIENYSKTIKLNPKKDSAYHGRVLNLLQLDFENNTEQAKKDLQISVSLGNEQANNTLNSLP
jgi:tetratricopeptide (TPR) repeat protein